ncbi:hypothetical protein ON010_g5981 [Phytophthora cinnamomi]|nr:hypothetical protein ON010_g5981 [Phytophthora cinnamomi]
MTRCWVDAKVEIPVKTFEDRDCNWGLWVCWWADALHSCEGEFMTWEEPNAVAESVLMIPRDVAEFGEHGGGRVPRSVSIPAKLPIVLTYVNREIAISSFTKLD